MLFLLVKDVMSVVLEALVLVSLLVKFRASIGRSHGQTNTADMLEEAVEYVKFLQKQIQELTEHQRNCKCIEKD
ncbi:hypothetical protein Pint_07293 [Pistacia integerrima]|uniref:Uncharacterized protein n=3 Tax=Pistacia TaxID=55512 RepID=A0ACC1AEV7_9ROSI|nr:hypothetical protein Pint_07436 [Pistacia integerrima]KAJ0025033.1 hypothetical protein Pint_07293 [Pistacia integerrima]KAJ0085884.1 hypothetical protein Patl1_07380 [Pistacia atlantica]